MEEYIVKKLSVNNIHVSVPGSKSITNRALLLAALADGSSLVKGTLKSDDSVHFINSLIQLGFNISEDESGIKIEGTGGHIPCKNAVIDVGSAGTAARFLTAMLALSDGEYTVNASSQMQKRPMKELLVALEGLGARFDYINEEYALPFRVKGRDNSRVTDDTYSNDGLRISDVDNYADSEYYTQINIDRSSQYLSALMMSAPMLHGRLTIELTGKRTAKSYVGITIKMMEDYGVKVENPSENIYIVDCRRRESVGSKNDIVEAHSIISYRGREYMCEPDVSAACYYYAMAAVTGCEAVVDNVYRDSMQGDIRFLDILERMGCLVYDTSDGVAVKGTGTLNGITVDMSDCSDQTMTLAAIAPYASSPVVINGVGHIRKQESDRLAAIADALCRMGIGHEEYEDGIKIMPGVPRPAHIDTYEDHRMAMAFAVTGLGADGIVIDDPECCRKTFPGYFQILDSLTQSA